MTADSALEGSTAASRVRSSGSTASQMGYPQGHLGHLTSSQEQALEEFKAALEKLGLWTRGPPAPSADDQTLLRYLRARRWVPSDAMAQFRDTEEWRKANDIDVLYRTIDLQVYEQSRRLYPQWTGRRDRRGIPLYVFEIRPLDSKTISQYEYQGSSTTFSQAKTDGKTNPGLLRLFALYENLTRFNHPFCTHLVDRENADVPITMSTNIVDISGVGLKQFWNLKGHMQAASQLATAHYPETLDRIFIIGAPAFFSTVWGWIKRWFDPITVSKIFVLAPHEVKPTLEAFIDPRNIPRKYGGELDYSFGQLSMPDASWDGLIQWENGHSGFPSGPLLWEDVDGGSRMACVQLGSANGQPQRNVICTMPKTWAPPVSGNQQQEEEEEEEIKIMNGLDAAATDGSSTRETDATADDSTPNTTAAATIADSLDNDARAAENGVVEAVKRLHIENEKSNPISPAVAQPPPSATVV